MVLARLTFEAVEQAQRLDIDVCHSVNLNLVGRAGTEQFRFAVDAFQVAAAREGPRRLDGGTHRAHVIH